MKGERTIVDKPFRDADKLQETFKELHGGKRSLLIDTEPTADVVEVVRCKDCKWWDNDGDAERCAHKYGGMWAKSDGYCSYGERADEEI